MSTIDVGLVSKATMNEEDLSRIRQVEALLQNRASGTPVQRMPSAEIQQLIQAAGIIGGGRAEGLSDGESLGRFIRSLVRERDIRDGGAPARAEMAEMDLQGRGLEADDIEVKNEQEMLLDREAFGYVDQDEADAAYGQKRDGNAYADNQRRSPKARQMRR